MACPLPDYHSGILAVRLIYHFHQRPDRLSLRPCVWPPAA